MPELVTSGVDVESVQVVGDPVRHRLRKHRSPVDKFWQVFGRRELTPSDKSDYRQIMPPKSPGYRMADRLADGRLGEVLLEMRADLSFREISKRLHSTYGIEVTDETIRGWIASLQAEAAEAAS